MFLIPSAWQLTYPMLLLMRILVIWEKLLLVFSQYIWFDAWIDSFIPIQMNLAIHACLCCFQIFGDITIQFLVFVFLCKIFSKMCRRKWNCWVHRVKRVSNFTWCFQIGFPVLSQFTFLAESVAARLEPVTLWAVVI